jgi:hypothetical protein
MKRLIYTWKDYFTIDLVDIRSEDVNSAEIFQNRDQCQALRKKRWTSRELLEELWKNGILTCT